MGGPSVASREFAAACEQLLPRIEDALKQAVSPEKLQPSDVPERLRSAMEYSLLAGGKRLRPVLVLLGCDACGGNWEDALPAACAVEMIHTYSLIHDDLPSMDNDDIRRGRPTCHRQFDDATAILAGDALLTLAFETMATEIADPAVAARCCQTLAQASGAAGMVGGQMADLAGEGRFDDERPEQFQDDPEAAVTHLEAIHRRKTGALLANSLKLGGIVARASTEQLDSLTIYGNSVGLAFQIADDVLDVVGSAQELGKGVRKDADLGKLTYPSVLGLDASRDRAETLIETAERAVAGFGSRQNALIGLARFVLERNH
ncbi:polyprenyl synthetase family protein [Thalassoroseus pseudoceratinae]|uniref:polyprenyl synthetase family protein n=1 Tax=Thalassoroseus pseudoceratinae TaxID=2713176 RepID=UPI00141EB353|nr:farnesyl diphosphate synthase [Thalassoroseus pseudoceratinae]